MFSLTFKVSASSRDVDRTKTAHIHSSVKSGNFRKFITTQ